jgi:hypothetical protein
LRTLGAELPGLVFGRACAHPHAPDPKRTGFQGGSHQLDHLGLGQAKLQGNGLKGRVVLPSHGHNVGDFGL